MAYETGTATDHSDLWDKLITFLTTDAELVANSEEWTLAWEAPTDADNVTDVVLQGPGLAAQDEIYVAMRRVDDVANDVSEFYLKGCTGVVASADAYDLHVNMQPFPVKMFARANTMDYWFVASGRRFIVVVQVGTVYESLYAGFFLPYGDPTVYNYPLFVGGTCGSGGPDESTDWRSTEDDHSCFVYSNYDSSPVGYEPSAWALSPQGDWLRCAANTPDANAYLGPKYFGKGLGLGALLQQDASVSDYGYDDIRKRMIEAYGDEYVLTPITITQASPGDQTYGILDGVYHAPGRGQSIENLIAANNTVHAVFQNAFRTALGAWFAVALYPEDSNSGILEDSNS